MTSRWTDELAFATDVSRRAGALLIDSYERLEQVDYKSKRDVVTNADYASERLVIDAIRSRRTQKHGGDMARQDLADVIVAAPELGEELLALNEALDRLAEKDSQKAELVKLRHFAGLTIEEAAQAMDISVTTANRYWAYARAWLLCELEGEG